MLNDDITIDRRQKFNLILSASEYLMQIFGSKCFKKYVPNLHFSQNHDFCVIYTTIEQTKGSKPKFAPDIFRLTQVVPKMSRETKAIHKQILPCIKYIVCVARHRLNHSAVPAHALDMPRQIVLIGHTTEVASHSASFRTFLRFFRV